MLFNNMNACNISILVLKFYIVPYIRKFRAKMKFSLLGNIYQYKNSAVDTMSTLKTDI